VPVVVFVVKVGAVFSSSFAFMFLSKLFVDLS